METITINSSDYIDFQNIYRNNNPMIEIKDGNYIYLITNYNDYLRKNLLLLLRNFIQNILIKENKDKLLEDLYYQDYTQLLEFITNILNNKYTRCNPTYLRDKLDMFEYYMSQNESKVQQNNPLQRISSN